MIIYYYEIQSNTSLATCCMHMSSLQYFGSGANHFIHVQFIVQASILNNGCEMGC